MACPQCPYCGWKIGEWADGKTKDRQREKCPACDKTFFYITYTDHNGGWFHVEKPLGRKSI